MPVEIADSNWPPRSLPPGSLPPLRCALSNSVLRLQSPVLARRPRQSSIYVAPGRRVQVASDWAPS